MENVRYCIKMMKEDLDTHFVIMKLISIGKEQLFLRDGKNQATVTNGCTSTDMETMRQGGSVSKMKHTTFPSQERCRPVGLKSTVFGFTSPYQEKCRQDGFPSMDIGITSTIQAASFIPSGFHIRGIILPGQ